jgi:transposase-like protein
MLLKWRDWYQVKDNKQVASLEASDLQAAQAEIRRLQAELAEVREERDILKKAVNIFSRQENSGTHS